MVAECLPCDFQLSESGKILGSVMLRKVDFEKKIEFYLSDGKVLINIEQGNSVLLQVFCKTD